jgi:hypothetical protein
VALPKAKAATKARSTKSTPSRRKDGSAIRQGSKTEKILGLLNRRGGATSKEVMKATGWQAHSVRGFSSGTLCKKLVVFASIPSSVTTTNANTASHSSNILRLYRR